LVLGKDPESKSDKTGDALARAEIKLTADDQGMDSVLEALYDSDRRAGLGSSSPNVNRWLGDIRKYFPTSVVRVLQRDAMDRLGLQQMLLEPETLAAVEPDVELIATLLSLKNVIPAKTKDTARQVVRKVVDQLLKKLRQPTIQAVRGAISRASRTYRPRPHEIEWPLTIRKNLKHYLVEHETIVLEKLVGHGRRRSALRDVILCVDQSGSMGTSVVYSSIFAAVLASIPSLRTRMVLFDTEVVDMTDAIQDPVDLLFGTQLGGGTDIHRALTYCQQHITRPQHTIVVLITDLFEGGDVERMFQRVEETIASGATLICLLALNDEGSPGFDESNAARMTELGVPTFACTPDQFPDLMSVAIQGQDIGMWRSRATT
jgi:hypothetical protein